MTAAAMKPINKKIPGYLPPLPKTDVDGKVSNLSTKTIPELLELRDRQQKLIQNKAFILKLPDKGAKIQAFHEKITTEITTKQNVQQTCSLFEKLNVNVDKESLQDVEWKGRIENREQMYLDSDDDSEPEDVIHILSQRPAQEKTVKVLQPEKPLITPEDLLKIGETPHVKYLVEKTESTSQTPKHIQFKPYKTTKSDVHNPEKEILRKKHKYWENTAATPPPIIHGPAKLLSLEESLKLETEYNVHLKEVETKHAAEKLLSRMGVKMADLPDDTRKFGRYRDTATDDSEVSDPEGSDKEVHDEEIERGGVIFHVTE